MCLRRSLSVSIRLCVCVWEQPVCVCLPHPSPFSFILQGLCWIWALIRCRPASQGHTCLDIHPGVPLQTKRPSSVTGQNLDFTCEKTKNCRIYLYFFWSSKRFYVITHLIGRSTCRKILQNICTYLKGHTWSLKSKKKNWSWRKVTQVWKKKYIYIFMFQFWLIYFLLLVKLCFCQFYLFLLCQIFIFSFNIFAYILVF